MITLYGVGAKLLKRMTSVPVSICSLWGFLCMLNLWIAMNLHLLLFSADVFSGSVDEPLEPGGDGEEGP